MNQSKILMESEIDRLSEELTQADPSSDEYANIAARVKDLFELLETHREYNNPAEPPSTIEKIINNGPLLSTLTTIGVAVAVLGHERSEIITSKAWNFVKR